MPIINPGDVDNLDQLEELWDNLPSTSWYVVNECGINSISSGKGAICTDADDDVVYVLQLAPMLLRYVLSNEERIARLREAATREESTDPRYWDNQTIGLAEALDIMTGESKCPTE